MYHYVHSDLEHKEVDYADTKKATLLGPWFSFFYVPIESNLTREARQFHIVLFLFIKKHKMIVSLLGFKFSCAYIMHTHCRKF